MWRGDEVLLIKRGKPPFEGMWSIPGGGLEYGETLQDAALRELMEETSVRAKIIGLIDVFQSIGPQGHYVMIDYVARWVSGEPVAGDDAAEAEFVPQDEALKRLDWDLTRDALKRSLLVLNGQIPAAKGR